MSATPFAALMDLVAFDKELMDSNRKISQLNAQVSSVQQSIADADTRLESIQQELHTVRKEVDSQELQMKELEAQEKNALARLDQVHNNKEYQSLQKELEGIRKQQFDNEQELVDVWNALENKQRQCNAYKAEHDARVKELLADVAQHSDDLLAEEKKRDELLNVRMTKEEKLPKEWREKYSMMHARVPDPVVKVVNDTCSACFFQVRHQDLLELARRKLLQCRECYRFLYQEFPGATGE